MRYSPNPSAAWSVYQYRPREWDALQIGGLDGRPYLNFMVARKTADSTNSEIPQQSVYAPTSAQYGGSRLADTSAQSNADAGRSAGRWSAARGMLERVPGALTVAQKIVRQARKALLNKPLVGRY